MKECDCGARFQVHERDCASLGKEKEPSFIILKPKTLMILTVSFCLLVGMVIGTHVSIYQVSEAHVFEKMAEGMTCESLIDTYQEDPEPVMGLPDDESSWWYVGIAGNDAMGNEITKRCITGLDSEINWSTIEPNGRVYEYTIAP